MRKMMEGVVLYGTGKPAQLNGYSSGGKTGTAQKIDPATHTYSKTMHIASFAGIAPVNNPVIAVSVVLDSPTKGPSYYGTAVSAPVFTEVAQQVLEYLAVPHDIEVRAPHVNSKREPSIAEDDSPQQGEDINQLYAAVNDLPADDPLRTETPGLIASKETPAQSAHAGSRLIADAKPAQRIAAPNQATLRQTTLERSRASQPLTKAVMVSDGKKLKVPSLVGLPVREVIERAGAAGLAVQVSGNGTVKEQAPAAGTMVATGTQVVVRCGH
jgi:cell division protein FtsI (penicillin-binding protein 3)